MALKAYTVAKKNSKRFDNSPPEIPKAQASNQSNDTQVKQPGWDCASPARESVDSHPRNPFSPDTTTPRTTGSISPNPTAMFNYSNRPRQVPWRIIEHFVILHMGLRSRGDLRMKWGRTIKRAVVQRSDRS